MAATSTAPTSRPPRRATAAARRARSARQLRTEAAITTLVSAVVLGVLWFVFVRLHAARQFENLVWESRHVLGRRVRVTQNRSLNLVTHTSLAVGMLAIVAVGLVRRRPALGAAVFVAVGGASVTTQVLKRIVINRPPTLGELARISANSFPSGHATICTALGLAAIVMTPHRWRRVTTVVAAAWTAYQCVGVVAAGWHRPSDALAGYAVALAWMSAAVWVLARSGRAVPDSEEALQVGTVQRLMVGLASVSVVALLVVAQLGGDTIFSRGGAAFLASCTVIVGAGTAVVWWFWLMLHDWSLDAPSPRRRRRDADATATT